MEPGTYVVVKALFTTVAVALVTTAALSGCVRKLFSFWVAVALTVLSVGWDVASVSLLISPSTALQVVATLGSPQAIYFFAFGALAPALACAAGLATLTHR